MTTEQEKETRQPYGVAFALIHLEHRPVDEVKNQLMQEFALDGNSATAVIEQVINDKGKFLELIKEDDKQQKRKTVLWIILGKIVVLAAIIASKEIYDHYRSKQEQKERQLYIEQVKRENERLEKPFPQNIQLQLYEVFNVQISNQRELDRQLRKEKHYDNVIYAQRFPDLRPLIVNTLINEHYTGYAPNDFREYVAYVKQNDTTKARYHREWWSSRVSNEVINDVEKVARGEKQIKYLEFLLTE